MRKSLLIVVVTALTALIPVSSALAAPYTLQRFGAKVVGKAGTDKKPASVGVYINPYHIFSDKGGPSDAGGVNSGALLEPAFATLSAHVYLPKEMSISTVGFPTCSEATILATPEKCPKGSEIGKGVAYGWARGSNEVPGHYLLAVPLTVRAFILSSKAITLRVISPLIAANVMTGVISKATGPAAKKYGTDIAFTLPKGLIEPLPGTASQLAAFDSTLKAEKNSKGKALMSLKACPKSKKLNFGYSAEYNIGLDKSTAPLSSTGFSISSKGPVVGITAPCK